MQGKQEALLKNKKSTTNSSAKEEEDDDDDTNSMTNSRLLARFLSQFRWYYWCINNNDNDNNFNTKHVNVSLLDAAWAHWEHNVLPRRYVHDHNQHKHQEQGEQDFCNWQRAPPGEIQTPTRPHTNSRRATKLYPIWKTPRHAIKNLSLRLYFNTLLLLAIILSITGLFYLPLIAYYYYYYYHNHNHNDKYSNINHYNLIMRGTAICTDTQWVYCQDCNIHNYDTTEQNWVRVNKCNVQDWYIPGLMGYIGSMGLVIGFAVVFYGLQRKAEIVFDEEMQTASDYSIKITNPPPNATDPEEWKAFLSSLCIRTTSNGTNKNVPQSAGGVRTVTIAVNNAKLLRTLVQRRKVWHRLRKILLIQEYHSSSNSSHNCSNGDQALSNNIDRLCFSTADLESKVVNAAASYQATVWDKIFLYNNPLLLFRELQGLDHRIRKLILKPETPYQAVTVFVTFETERAQRDVLHALSQGKMNVWRNQPDTSRFHNNTLQVQETNRNAKLQISTDDICLVSEAVYMSITYDECTAPEDDSTRYQQNRYNNHSLESHVIRVVPSDNHNHDNTAMNTDANDGNYNTQLANLLKFRGQRLLAVSPAPEPNNVRWLDLQVSRWVRMFHFVLSTLVFLCLLAASGFFIASLRNKEKENRTNAYVPVYITISNFLVPKLCEWINRYESHSTEGSRQVSLYIKMALFRWFNSAICLLIITRFVDTISVMERNTNMDEEGNTQTKTSYTTQSLPSSVYPIIFAEMFTIPLIKMFDPVNTFRRHILAPWFLSTSSCNCSGAIYQEDLNRLFRGSKLELAERYTDASKVLFVALAYSQMLPEAFFLAAIALTVHYWSGKFCYYRVWRPVSISYHCFEKHGLVCVHLIPLNFLLLYSILCLFRHLISDQGLLVLAAITSFLSRFWFISL